MEHPLSDAVANTSRQHTSPRASQIPGVSIRHDWQAEEVLRLLKRPFNELLFHAQSIHRQCFDPTRIQLSTLINIKSGGCPEDCAYCPQSARYTTGVEQNRATLSLSRVKALAREARARGAGRLCMGAAWRGPKNRDLSKVLEMIREVKAMGLETCATLGMLSRDQAQHLKQAGLDFYNHNIDSSPEYYARIISTRSFQDRIDTLRHVREAGIRVCCGGIIGMGESQADRAGFLVALANLPQHPESVPVNRLVKVAGTPLADADVAPLDALDFVRVIAVARIMMPMAWLRLSAGRKEMDESLQALCFLAGANSIFYGETLLTTANPRIHKDRQLIDKLGMIPVASSVSGKEEPAHADPRP